MWGASRSESLTMKVQWLFLLDTLAGDVTSEYYQSQTFLLMIVSFCLSSCLCCLRICLRSSILSWRKSLTRSSPSRELLSLMWWSTCGRIRSPTAWSTPLPLWVCASRRPWKSWKEAAHPLTTQIKTSPPTHIWPTGVSVATSRGPVYCLYGL